MSALVAGTIRAHAPFVRREMAHAHFAMKREVRRHPGWLPASNDADRLRLEMGIIRSRVRAVLRGSGHSRHYWFQLARRAAAALWDCREPDVPESDKQDGAYAVMARWHAVPDLARTMSALVLSSGCADDAREWGVSPGGTGIRYFFTPGDIRALAQLASLSGAYSDCISLYRLASLGAEVLDTSPSRRMVRSRPTVPSVGRYDERFSRYETIAGAAGLWCDPFSVTATRPLLCRFWTVTYAGPRGFRIVGEAEGDAVSGPWLPTHLAEVGIAPSGAVPTDGDARPHPDAEAPPGAYVRTLPYDTLLARFHEPIEAAVGCSVSALTAFLYAVQLVVMGAAGIDCLIQDRRAKMARVRWPETYDEAARRDCTMHQAEIAQLGLLRLNRDGWLHWLHQMAQVLCASDPSIQRLTVEEVSSVFDRFTSSGPDLLTSTEPVLFVRLSDHTIALDLMHSEVFMRSLLLKPSELGRGAGSGSGQSWGDMTGQWLNEQAGTFFERELGLDPAGVLKEKHVGGRAREIDLAFVYRGMLFVIDCKAAAKDPAFWRGEHSVIRNRLDRFRQELEIKNPHRIQLIREGAAPDVIAPDSFSQASSLVCTSAVEYLPVDDKGFWHRDLPLVGPPEELLQTIKQLSHR